ncbi:MAG: hypothetical protein Q4B09_04160 [Lachnospiraceae bacterium]|nr:hypothetical protein [Lachnospiraceae bacterium]
MRITRFLRLTAAAAACILAVTGCSMIPSPTLDEDVMSAANKAESAAADAASVLAAVQEATDAMNAAVSGQTNDDLDRTRDKTFKMVTIKSKDGRYSIKVPETWQNLKGKLDPKGMDKSFLIETGSYDDQIFLIFTAESTEDSSLTSFDDFFTSLTLGVTGSSLFTDVQSSTPETLTLKSSQLQGRKVAFTALYHPSDTEEQWIAYRIYGAQGKGVYLQFCCWTTAANSALSDEVIDTVVNSFKVLK